MPDPSPPHAPATAQPAADRLFVGAMSGTSADGVDAAVVAVAGRGTGMSCRLVRHHHVPYPAGLRRDVFAARQTGSVELAALATMTRDVSLCYARAVTEALVAAGVAAADVAAVAAHGQTLFHDPPCTIQVLDPSLVAAGTGCPVVSDFRRADCAAGGQGAPLVPYADYVLFRHPTRTRVLLNIGGIANLSHLPAGGGPTGGVSGEEAALGRVTALDTGPGNCVSDHLVRSHDPAGPGYDAGGTRAARGGVVDAVVRAALADPYFAAAGPKSTDGPAMIALYERAVRASGVTLGLDDQLRTACTLTAESIAAALRRLDPAPDELVVSGGGAKNATLMALLRQATGGLPVRTTDELGVPGDAKEAIAFALLAAATLDGLPGNVPSATGASRAVVLGSVTPRA